MRALILILATALIALWSWFGVHVDSRDEALPVRIVERGEPEVSAASLNNEAVRLASRGRHADALAYLERAHTFRPSDPVVASNLERQRARLARRAWLRALVPATVGLVLFAFVAGAWHTQRRLRDGLRLARLRLRGDSWFHIPRDAEQAELDFRFTDSVEGLIRRHPLQIVWSSAAHGKHMKSSPPCEARGRHCLVRLDGERLERLRRHPGSWKGFLYLGKRPVGEAAARVG